MNKKYLVIFICITAVLFIFAYRNKISDSKEKTPISSDNTITISPHPLNIISMRKEKYPGSPVTIEKTLPDTPAYHQFIASYISDGLKIYALLTVPQATKPKNGWPVILFNHGYIPPEIYRTTERYTAYVDVFARNGYIVFKPDYRGNGESEGQPEGAYYSPAYTIDNLNALSSIKQYADADPNRIGIWGHSMGGNITIRDLVIVKDIKAAVIWGGVVGSYNDLMNNWHRKVPYQPSPRELALRNRNRQNLIAKYGTPQTNPDFWNSIDPTFYVRDINTPIQLNTGEDDEDVPKNFSQSLKEKLEKEGKTVELHIYPNDNHNISIHFNEAMNNSVSFFDKYLK